mgnify:CR=1 FL=1|tara:strand:- start:2034 stop:2654 length:621 start_codon:yes stop_codon:yes gene_type:complete
MDNIEKELDEKSIEKLKEMAISETGPTPEPEPVKKTKKIRSAAQIAAFEKARKARAEKIAQRKKDKQEVKIQKKEERKIVKEKVKEELNKPKTSIEEQIKIDNDLDHGEYRSSKVSFTSDIRKEPVKSADPRDQVVNNYYYYGMSPPQPQPHYNEPVEKKSKKSRRKKRPPTPSSSESSDEEIPELEPPVQPVYYPPKPGLKFNYA